MAQLSPGRYDAQKWHQHRLSLPSTPAAQLCAHNTHTHTQDRRRTWGGRSKAHPLLLVRVHKALVHNGASGCSKGNRSRSNDYSQLQRGKTEANA